MSQRDNNQRDNNQRDLNQRDTDPKFEEILTFLHQSRGFDFKIYKRTSLTRRVRVRMQIVGIESFADYLDYLQVHPDEFVPLLNTILINVTSFFRDKPAWDHLATEILPRILATILHNEPSFALCYPCYSPNAWPLLLAPMIDKVKVTPQLTDTSPEYRSRCRLEHCRLEHCRLDSMMQINIFLADDNNGFRQALHELLSMEPNFVVIGEAANGHDAVAQIAKDPPDIAVLDITMPKMDGLAATREIRQQCPAVQVVIVSLHDTKQHIHEALESGANGYVLKESAGDELADALRAVNAGQRFLSAQIADSWPLDIPLQTP